MDLRDYSVGVVAVVGTLWILDRLIVGWRSSAERRRVGDYMLELRFFDFDWYRPAGDTFSGDKWIDFERMVLVEESVDYNFHHTRVLELRRFDGPRWESRETRDSWHRSLRHLEDVRSVLSEEQWKERSAEPKWEPLELHLLEQRYQRYLFHYRPLGGKHDRLEKAIASDETASERRRRWDASKTTGSPQGHPQPGTASTARAATRA